MPDGSPLDPAPDEGGETPVYTAPAEEPPPNPDSQPSRGEPGATGGGTG